MANDFGGAGPLRLLVADSYPDAARTLALALTCTGEEARWALDGPAALRLAAEWRPDAVLLDFRLEEVDGCEVARRLRELPGLEAVVLVALTGYTDEEHRRLARKSGFHQYLLKPVAPDVLRPLILATREGGQRKGEEG
jgi:two-component system CheB/CheR fusion protein